MDPKYVFGTHKSGAYITPKERLFQHLINPDSPLKSKKTDWEAMVNQIFGSSHMLNDDEYRFMSKKGAY